MHELSIAQAILDHLAVEAKKHPNSRFTKVGLRIGEVSGIDADALSFGLEALVKDTPLDPLALDIQTVPRAQRCCQCGHEFPAPESQTACPKCGCEHTVCVRGEEMDIAYVEVEDA